MFPLFMQGVLIVDGGINMRGFMVKVTSSGGVKSVRKNLNWANKNNVAC